MQITWLQKQLPRPRQTVGWWLAGGGAALILAGALAAGHLISILPWMLILMGCAAFVVTFAPPGAKVARGPAASGLLSALLQGAGVPIFVLDREGRVQGHWNAAAQARFGPDAAQAEGLPMPVLLPGFQEETRRVLAQVFQGEAVTGLPGQGLAKGGASFPLNLNLTPVFGPEGTVEAALVTVAEDGFQKTRIATLATLLGDKAALLDAVGYGGLVVWALDPGTGKLVHVSSGAQDLLGLTRERLLADPAGLPRLLAPGDREAYQHAQAEALAGQVGVFEAPLGGGRARWTRWTLDLAGGRLRGVIQDLTETRDLREQLFHSQKMETLGEFLSVVTHDFNNILMSILGYNELMLLDAGLTEDQRRRLEVMHRSASRGHALARRLLRYARKGPPVRKFTDLNELIAEVVALLEESTDTSIRCRSELDPELPYTVVEPSELHQVLMNLGVNARDALAGGGEITFRSGVVDALAAAGMGFKDTEGPCILLEIQDTGPGLPAELQERIFEPFTAARGTGKGSGLGLALVQRIVNAHGGVVRCLSRQGQGTLFQVLLPVKGREKTALATLSA